MRTCTKCGLSKPLSDFVPRRDSACKYRPYCKMCGNKINRDNYKKHAKKRIAKTNAYRRQHLDKYATYSIKWQEKIGIEKLRAIRRKGYHNRIINNPEGLRANWRKTRAKRIQMIGVIGENYTPSDERHTRVVFNNSCFRCDTKMRLEIDHHYPLSLGNPLTIGNAVLLCKSCNSSKGNRLPEAFYDTDQLLRLSVLLGDQ